MTGSAQSERGPVGDFMDAHRSFGDVPCRLYGTVISVAASAVAGKPRISVHGGSDGLSVGGLMGADEARQLVGILNAAIDYAEQVARDQRVAAIPELERRLEDARLDAARGEEPS